MSDLLDFDVEDDVNGLTDTEASINLRVEAKYTTWSQAKGETTKGVYIPPELMPVGFCLEYLDQVYKLGLLGATSAQMAEFFNVKVEMFERWQHELPEFDRAIREGKDMADANVAKSMYNRACGYKHIESKVTSYLGEPVVTEVTKHYPPDTAAGIFWLQARQRDTWGKNAQANDEISDLFDDFANAVNDAGED